MRLPENIAKQLEQETGLLLASVEAGSPAERDGLILGDAIVSLNGQPTRSLDELLGTLSGDSVGKTIPARIVRGGNLQELNVTVGERD